MNEHSVVGVVHNKDRDTSEETVPPVHVDPASVDGTESQVHGDPVEDRSQPCTDTAGDRATDGASATNDRDAAPPALAADAIRTYVLADDEVLLDAGEGRVQVISLRALVCDDIRATESSFVPVRTEPYYSVAHYLGEGGDEWMPEEERKIERHRALHDELDAVYRSLGAFSLEEALGQYFTADLVRRYAGGSPGERERVRGWLRYVRGDAGASLTNPAGFLRTRLESPQWAPSGAAPSTARGGHRHRR